MKMYVKIVSVAILALLLTFSLVSCEGDRNEDNCTGTSAGERTSFSPDSIIAPEKPVIYLYPEEDTVCSVKLTLDGKLTCTYPEHSEDGWQNFVAKPDGTLVFPNGREYYCLYWEGISDATPDYSEGFCVKGENTAEFLEKTLAEIGLNEREANEFIIYWLPIMQENEYNVISFQKDAYTNSAKLDITPTPDSILRVYMSFYASDEYVEMKAQRFDGFERVGFTVVEWGGGENKIGK